MIERLDPQRDRLANRVGEEREGLRRYAANYYDYKETYLAEAAATKKP